MNTELLAKIEQPFLRSFPQFKVGDTIAVKSKFKEGKKLRTQTFKGIVLAIKGSGIRTTFTIRKISYGIGVEKILPLHSPAIEKIEVLRHGRVTKSKLYYMRKRIGKRALKVQEDTEFSESADNSEPEEPQKSGESVSEENSANKQTDDKSTVKNSLEEKKSGEEKK